MLKDKNSESGRRNRKYTLRRFLGDILFVVVVFYAITWWQERDLLPDDGNQKIPTLTVSDSKSDRVELASLLGEENTIIYFFAPWCSICRTSAPNLNKLSESVTVLAIALSYEKRADVARFVQETALNVPVYYGSDNTEKAFKIDAFPTYYVVDSNGIILDRSVGYSTEFGMKWRSR